MNEMKNIFADKDYPEEFLGLLDNFIYEFGELYGKFVSKDELILRIKNNVDHFEFLNESAKSFTLGSYSCNSKTVSLARNLSIEDMKEVIFHELIHAIVKDEEGTGIHRNYFGEEGVSMGRGFNEGVDQWLTKIRNDRFKKGKSRFNSYPILTECVEEFCILIGEDFFIDTYLNKPDLFLYCVNEKLGMLSEEESPVEDNQPFNVDFLYFFDVLHDEEKEVYQNRAIDNLFESIFGQHIEEEENIELNRAKEGILSAYTRVLFHTQVVNADDFEAAILRCKNFQNIISFYWDVDQVDEMVEFLDPALRKTIVENRLPEGEYIMAYLKQKEFAMLPRQKRLEKFSQFFEEYDNLYNLPSPLRESFQQELFASLSSNLCHRSEVNSFFLLVFNLDIAPYLLKNHLNMDNICFDIDRFDDGTAIRLHRVFPDHSTKSYALFGTLELEEDTEWQLEGDEKKDALLEKHPEFLNKIDAIYCSKQGDLLIYTKHEGAYFYQQSFGDFERAESHQFLDSINMRAYQMNQERLARMERLCSKSEHYQKLLQPNIKNIKKALKDLEQEMANPSDIALNSTGNDSLDEV